MCSLIYIYYIYIYIIYILSLGRTDGMDQRDGCTVEGPMCDHHVCEAIVRGAVKGPMAKKSHVHKLPTTNSCLRVHDCCAQKLPLLSFGQAGTIVLRLPGLRPTWH